MTDSNNVIPDRELWLYRNPEALRMLTQGQLDIREGRVVYLGSFATYAETTVSYDDPATL